MSDSRDSILGRLRAARPLIQPPPARRDAASRVVPMDDTTPGALVDRFVREAQSLQSQVHQVESDQAAVDRIRSLIGEDRRIQRWAFEHIPVEGLEAALSERGIGAGEGRDPSIRIGLTGVDAALAATGSLVLEAGPGKPRLASLLPPVHIAVVRPDQIIPDLETWVGEQRTRGVDAYRRLSSVMVISGPSRTADIAMELILGMHGPGELHIVLVGGPRTDRSS